MLKFMHSFLKLCMSIVCVSSKFITKNKENKVNLINQIGNIKGEKNFLNHGEQKIQSEVAKLSARASLVAQWLRICLPMPGIHVRALGPGRSHMPQSN